MSKISRPKEGGGAKFSFYPFRDSTAHFQVFSERYAQERGLRVRPNRRDVFQYVLQFAELGWAARGGAAPVKRRNKAAA